MSGEGIASLNIATGISLLPIMHNNRPLFVAALSLLACGLIVLAITIMLAHKSNKSELKVG
jgi:hypothetical protein